MAAYTLKEVSKKINVNSGLIRQWEKEFAELLNFPRSKQGARIYTDLEVDYLLEIKTLHSQKLGKEIIRQTLQQKSEPPSDLISEDREEIYVPFNVPESFSEDKMNSNDLSVNLVTETVPEVIEIEEKTPNVNQFFEALDTYTKNFLDEVKEEIRTVVRKELLEDVKKEIKNGTLTTVKSLSDSIYKSTANTKADIEELTETFESASKLNADRLKYLSDSIKNVSIETYDEISTLSKQIAETTEDLTNYIENTNFELSHLSEAIIHDREFFMEEREQYLHEVQQREIAFQQMLTNFREVAGAKEKKWWKFWN
ncbi:MerR family transcriptional regulator [Neobacillus sp. LXY-1]|uniref:MerR family transcriptional regulator n=1 Tax=Neobacillus sp. LXY-1 TaxID=3379133 RepID=UPI003EDFFFC0